jgi:hypothetical protein
MRAFLSDCKPIRPRPSDVPQRKPDLEFVYSEWARVKQSLLPFLKRPYRIRVKPIENYGDYLAE